MSSVAPTEERTLVSKPEQSALYMSARSGLRLVKRPKLPIRDQTGQEVDQTPGERIDFDSDAVLRVPLDRDADVELPTGVTLKAGEIHDWLQKHKTFGDRFEGFWKVDQPAPPITQQELENVLDLALRLDEDGLVALIEQEQSGYARSDLLEAAKGSLAKLREMKVPEKAEEPKKPGPKPKEPGVSAA
jgi:hypothetical protein